MAGHRTTHRSRKRHSGTKSAVRARSAAVPPQAPRTPRAPARTASSRTYGERPAGLFGGLPVSEVMIFVGAIGMVVGWLQGGGVALFVGLGVCFLAVLELTVREHFSGYRSHSTLLAAIAAVAVETAVALLVAPRDRLLLLVAVVPVFAGVFALVRKRFTIARQARVRAIPQA
ncbi:MAG TPA: hypothetical protein VKT31_09340 [Solirubrobacteraceae bacterium]|nr:hypothetical protein [Solirubrobacteraceae bacterium]